MLEEGLTRCVHVSLCACVAAGVQINLQELVQGIVNGDRYHSVKCAVVSYSRLHEQMFCVVNHRVAAVLCRFVWLSVFCASAFRNSRSDTRCSFILAVRWKT